MYSTLLSEKEITKTSVNLVNDKKIIFWDNFNIIFKTTGMITWFCILILALLEIKRYFNIDLIPGYDSAIDDAYGAIRGSISGSLGK